MNKTDIMRQVAESLGLELRDIRLSTPGTATSKLEGWYWCKRDDIPHFTKHVKQIKFDCVSMVHEYPDQGLMIMDDFGELTSCSVAALSW